MQKPNRTRILPQPLLLPESGRYKCYWIGSRPEMDPNTDPIVLDHLLAPTGPKGSQGRSLSVELGSLMDEFRDSGLTGLMGISPTLTETCKGFGMLSGLFTEPEHHLLIR